MPATASSHSKPPPQKRRKIQVTSAPVPTKTKKGIKQAVTGPSSLKNPAQPELKGKSKTIVAEPSKPATVVPDAQVLPRLPKTFKIIAGSYEKLLYGLEAAFAQDGDPGSSKLELKPIFIFPAHVSCVKAVAASPSGGKWLATGSSDEIIKVWDLRRRKEIGGLMHHEGSITYLTFPSRSHLLSASEDGTICLFHARDWSVLRTLKGHKGRVNCVAVHPSGKLALSVGEDRTLRMWDLMRGKGSASTKIGKEGEVVCWSPSGLRFAVQTGKAIDLFSTKMVLQYTITHPSRVHDIRFFVSNENDSSLEFLLVAAEDKKVTVYELSANTEIAPKVIAEFVGHGNRVKAIDIITISIPPYADLKSATYATTISSDGCIRIFDLNDIIRAHSALAAEQPVPIVEVTRYDTKGSRLTCLTVGDGELVMNEFTTAAKRKRAEENDKQQADEDPPSEDEDESGV
ncbi:WD40 repeat-like protein [Hysterangium stoloniferum]|nr:WD40 repeat-like protein [Hysterangium stoloniferum]